LPKSWEMFRILGLPLPRITNASGRRIPARGVVQLYVQIGDAVKRVRFYVTPGLAVPCILGCNFINLHVKAILPKEQKVILQEGGTVAISPGIGKEECGMTEFSEVKPPPPQSKLRLARKVLLPPRCEAHVMVESAGSGLCFLQSSAKTYATNGVSLANGVADIRPHVPLKVRVINTSDRQHTLQKGMILGWTLPHPTQILTVPTGKDRKDGKLIGRSAPEISLNMEQSTHDGQHPDVPGQDATNPVQQWTDQVDLSHLESAERQAVTDMLEPHQAMWDGHLGEVTATKHRIDLIPGAKPVHSQPYRAGTRAREIEKAEIEKMLAQGVIEPATCEWASPIVMVPKPDGSLRFCVDYRKLNAITVPDTYPLPRMDECIDSLGEAAIFTTLDCNSGYWQIPVDPADRDKTTFTSHYGIYRFIRLPFGLRNAPGTFQRAVDIILSGVKWKTCLVYLDDVIVFSPSREAHMRHVDEALTLLEKAGLSLKLAKCQFFKDTVNYLGHVIRPGRLGVAEKNTEALKSAPIPCTQTELRSFLGLCNVYRRFVPRFATIAAPLTALLGKGTPAQLAPLTPAQIYAFESLRTKLLSPPILALPRSEGRIWLDTDASDGQLGCCLLQAQPDGSTLPLGYWSRTLNTAERNYSTTERECLAIVWAVTHLRPYVEGKRFTVRTDHNALRWVMNLSDAQGRLARWRLRLAEFDFQVEYSPGASHHAADAMSRLPHQPVPDDAIDAEIPVLTVEADALEAENTSPIAELTTLTVEALFEKQCLDPSVRHLAARLTSDPRWGYDPHGILGTLHPSGEFEVHIPPSVAQEGPCVVIAATEDGADLGGGVPARPIALQPPPLTGDRPANQVSLDELRRAQADDEDCQRWTAAASAGKLFDLDDRGILVRIAPVDGVHQVVVPKSLVARVLHAEHYPPVAAHPGAHRMFATLRRTFFWPRMAADIYDTVRQCDACARNRIAEKKHTNVMQLFPANGPMESVAMDILGPLPRTKHGNRFLLVIADRFTKVTITVPLRTVTALAVAKAFCDRWVYVYGPPISLLTDNGPQFTAKFFQAVCAELGVKKTFTTAYHPQTNGQVERYNRTILAALRAYVSKRQDDWDDFTSAVTYAYNCRVHSSLGMAPFEIVLSRPPPSISLETRPRNEEVSVGTAKQEFLERLKTLRLRARENLHKAQARYKRNYDRGIQTKNADLTEGDEAFVKVEVTEQGRNSKLESLVQGPYRVVENAGTTLRLQIGEETVRVSSDRVTPAPRTEETSDEVDSYRPTRPSRERDPVNREQPESQSPPEPRPRSILRSSQSPRNPHRVRFRSTPSELSSPDPQDFEDREYVIDRVVDADAQGRLYRVRWLGYEEEEDTWEPEENLPGQFIRRYWRKLGGRNH
jgi:transposase InsO family protein